MTFDSTAVIVMRVTLFTCEAPGRQRRTNTTGVESLKVNRRGKHSQRLVTRGHAECEAIWAKK